MAADLPPLVVAVPARNEEARITRTLRALGRQQGETVGTYRVVVLANNCTDRTAAEARRAAQSLPYQVEVIEQDFMPEHAHVGHARGRVLALAAAQLHGHPAGLLATTDADTVVAPDWASRLRLALSRADLVGGRILILPEERANLPRDLRRLQLQDAVYHLLSSRLRSLLDPEPYDPWPRHHQHFGASLGLRLSAWNQLGAWPQVRCLEDVALVQEMRRLDLRVRHCPQVRVWTSARDCGRVETGLSSQLREWRELQAREQCWTVPGAAEVQAEAAAGAALRRARSGRCRRRTDARSLEALWMVGPDALTPALSAPTLGLARELALSARHASGQWHGVYPPVPLDEALLGLRRVLHTLNTSAPA